MLRCLTSNLPFSDDVSALLVITYQRSQKVEMPYLKIFHLQTELSATCVWCITKFSLFSVDVAIVKLRNFVCQHENFPSRIFPC